MVCCVLESSCTRMCGHIRFVTNLRCCGCCEHQRGLVLFLRAVIHVCDPDCFQFSDTVLVHEDVSIWNILIRTSSGFEGIARCKFYGYSNGVQL